MDNQLDRASSKKLLRALTCNVHTYINKMAAQLVSV